MASINNFAVNGFERYATQPTSCAACQVASLSSAVMNITGRAAPAALSSRLNSIPDLPVKLMSKKRQMASPMLARSQKDSAESNNSTSNPWTFSKRSSPLSTLGSSSTTNTTFRLDKIGTSEIATLDHLLSAVRRESSFLSHRKRAIAGRTADMGLPETGCPGPRLMATR
jgi:hypothetical protein